MSGEAPLVIMLHGAGTQGRAMIDFTGWSDLAASARFHVVYPNGTGRNDSLLSWNCGGRSVPAARAGVDDVGFLHAVIGYLFSLANVDPRRIFAAGMSNGAAMCYRLAAECPGAIQAIGTVAGTMVVPPSDHSPSMNIIHFHGTDDRYVPFDGGRGIGPWSTEPRTSVSETIESWAAHNQCTFPPIVRNVVLEPGRDEPITQSTFPSGRDGVQVVLYSIPGGGHTWPGRPNPYPALGHACRSIQATDVIWEFFRQVSTTSTPDTSPVKSDPFSA